VTAFPDEPGLPLAGLRILDLSWVGVGPITVKYLADHGATAVRVESHVRPDVVRLGPPWHDAKPGLERSQFYADFNTYSGMTLAALRSIDQGIALSGNPTILGGGTGYCIESDSNGAAAGGAKEHKYTGPGVDAAPVEASC